jgi:hypothetical protein
VWGTALGLLALGLVLTGGSSRADFDAGVKAALEKIATALENNKTADASAAAKALAKKVEELNDVMHAFKPRTGKGKIKGWGVGNKAGVVVPDGIELKYNSVGRDGITPQQLAKEGDAIAESAWVTAAICSVAIHKPSEKVKGAAKLKKWTEYAEGAIEGAKELAKAAKDKNASAVKEAIVKMNNKCNSCHMDFR